MNFNIGTVPMRREQDALAWASGHFKRDFICRPLPMNNEKPNGWVPFRNSLLVLAAAQIDPTVVLAAVAEWAPDKNFRWARRLEQAVNQKGSAATAVEQLCVEMPFACFSKGDLLYEYHQNFGAAETRLLLERTWSCYLNNPAPCLLCGGCRQRIAAQHQYAILAGQPRPVESAPRWRIPLKDRFRWIRDNGAVGLRQIAAHTRQDDALEAS
ncbi:MAG: 7-cyano-7-deazaguanine synthase [Planctomycetota bacterium]